MALFINTRSVFHSGVSYILKGADAEIKQEAQKVFWEVTPRKEKGKEQVWTQAAVGLQYRPGGLYLPRREPRSKESPLGEATTLLYSLLQEFDCCRYITVSGINPSVLGYSLSLVSWGQGRGNGELLFDWYKLVMQVEYVLDVCLAYLYWALKNGVRG